jgi:hypothetical protein
VLVLPAEGPPVDAHALIGAAWGQETEWLAVSVARLPAGFFDLRTGVAGELLQKLANHRLKLAVLGEVSQHVAASDAFRDFVREANRGQQVWFVADEAELSARLKG